MQLDVEAVARAALRLAHKEVNVLPSVVNTDYAIPWDVYIASEKIGQVPQDAAERLLKLKRELTWKHTFDVQEVSLVDKPLDGRTLTVIKKPCDP